MSPRSLERLGWAVVAAFLVALTIQSLAER